MRDVWYFLLGTALGASACAGTSINKSGETTTNDSAAPPDRGCNGHEALCSRKVTEVTFAGTHNSMSNADAGWLGPNQQHGLTQQLNDGIRALMLDTYEEDGALWLCHGYCELGAQPLGEGLGEIQTFLAAHPREVVQIIFEDHIPLERTQDALNESGLSPFLYTWQTGADPTLADLIEGDTRLIVGLESGASDGAGVHAAWSLWADTPYSFNDVSAFSCELNRGSVENPLFLINHWLGPLPTPEAADAVNVAAVLEARARECVEVWGRPVNFLGVDFYDRGDLFAVVDRLNGIETE